MKHSDLTPTETYLIHNAVLCGLRPEEIARALRRDRSTIYDELKRGRRHRLEETACRTSLPSVELAQLCYPSFALTSSVG